MGMWGGDDPDTRRPLLWSDYSFEDEHNHPFGLERRPDVVSADHQLTGLYRELIALRKANQRLFIDGATKWLTVDDEHLLLAYERHLGEQSALVVFDASNETHALEILQTSYRQVYPSGAADIRTPLTLPPLSARVYLSM